MRIPDFQHADNEGLQALASQRLVFMALKMIPWRKASDNHARGLHRGLT